MAGKTTNNKTPAKKTPAKPHARTVFIDYPQDGEVIRPGDYTIRIGASAGHDVEVAFNGKGWSKCRAAAGYYWYDWKPEKPGKVRIVARARNGGNRTSRSLENRCVIEVPRKK
ncbi:MAG: hypothetical protein ABIJ96_11355 [Elusimicrobiota bacterium]